MNINPQILKIIKDNRLPETEAMFFCLTWWFKKFYPKAEDILFLRLGDKKVINLENEELYRVNFLKSEEGELVLKYPLFIKEQVNDRKYEIFCKHISESRLLNNLGHVNRPQDYPVYSEKKIKVYDVTREVRDIFNEVASTIKDFDPIKAAEVVIKHYENTKPAANIGRYLQEGFSVDYSQYD